MRKARVLLVDDEALLAANFSKILTLRGYDAYYACDGHSALQVLEENIFDVVVLDIRMQGMNGMKALKHIRDASPELQVLC